MDTLKADQVLQDKLRSLENVEVSTSVQTLEVQGNGEAMTALRIKNRLDETESILPLDGVFVQIGLAANSQPFAGELDTNRMGEILTDRNCRLSHTRCLCSQRRVSDVVWQTKLSYRWVEGARLPFLPLKQE